jgi:hypothetical protein
MWLPEAWQAGITLLALVGIGTVVVPVFVDIRAVRITISTYVGDVVPFFWPPPTSADFNGSQLDIPDILNISVPRTDGHCCH